jgi:hypothetical protein
MASAQAAGRPTWARRATSATGRRAAAAKTIRARATCFWEAVAMGDDRLETSTVRSRHPRTDNLSHGPASHVLSVS